MILRLKTFKFDNQPKFKFCPYLQNIKPFSKKKSICLEINLRHVFSQLMVMERGKMGVYPLANCQSRKSDS